MFVFLFWKGHIILTLAKSRKYNLGVFPEKQTTKKGADFMKVLYAKVVLYAYAHLETLAGQIDEIVEKKALSSSTNFSPAIDQFESIINLTYQKDIIFALKKCADKALSSFTEREKEFLDYKYFHVKPKGYYVNFDASSRGYFRMQVRLAEKFAKAMEKAGYSDLRFDSECLTLEFFREMLSRVKERENLNRKNKSAEEKAQVKKVKAKIAQNAEKSAVNFDDRSDSATISA